MMDNRTKDHASAIHVALFIFPKIMREMINNKWTPKDVLKRIEMDNGQTFKKKLTQEAKSMISNMKINGYLALDVCCLYHVIRYFNLLSSPKQGWGVNPKSDDKRKADDVERMKILRNNIIHCPQGGLSESDRKKFFEQSIDIAERMDKRNGSPVNGFKSEIEKVQIDSVSIASQENFEKCPKYQGKLQITTDKRYVSLYYGNDIMMKIDAQNDQENVTKKEVTVAIIKPDAVKAGKVDQILENIREAGIIILLQKEIKFTEEDIKQLYLHLQDQDFFKDLVQFMTSDISHVLVLTKGKSGENIIEEFKDLIGPSDIKEATTKKPNSLRAKYGQHTFRNALHGSYSSEMAKRELAFFFPDFVVPSLESKPDKLQTTLALLRPEAFRLYKEKILIKIRELGFNVAMQKEELLTREKAEEFYKEQKDKEYFEQFIKNMTSDSVLALGLSKKNAIREWKKLLGPKEVSKAKNEAPESLRAQFAVHDTINSLHGSDSEETAKKELQLFFPLEETVAIIKPDAERHKDEIVDKIHKAGFKITDRKETILSKEIAEKLYAGHKLKDYYIDLIEHMTSGPTYFMVLSRENAVNGLKLLIGPTDPKEAKKKFPDSIRALYGESKLKNAVNGSFDSEHTEKTIKTIFGDRSIPCILYLRDPNIDRNAILQKIDDIKEYIRTGNFETKNCIELTDIKLGSLILHVTISHSCFMSKEILLKTLQSFLHKFFIAASYKQGSEHNLTTVLAESDLLFAESTNRDDLDYLNEKLSPVLKLNVNVKNSAFNSELVLHREVNRFISGMNNAEGVNNVPVNGSAREVLMLAENESGENVTSISYAKQNPQFRKAQNPVLSELESNYFKISTLLLRIAPKAVRIKFDDLFQKETLMETLKSNSNKLTDLKNKRCINQVQWNSLFPSTGLPTSQSFDTTLMVVLFRNLKNIQIINQLPPPEDNSVGADLSRIKKYRKKLANFTDTTLSKTKFTAYWNDTEAAVMRLSDGTLKRECGNVKTKTYDVADRKKMHSCIQAGKRLIKIEELNEVADRVEKIDLNLDSDKKQDLSENQIEEWQEERKWFVQTNAFNFILSNIDKRCFTVVGNAGMGKSMLLHQTALFLKDSKGYSIISCHSPTDILSQFRTDTNQVFVLDDVCGQFKLVQSYVDKWNKNETRIQRVLESKTSIILSSCRSKVFRENECQGILIFSGCLCDLNVGDCKIDNQQKLNIANQYLSQETISELMSDLDSFDMFPLLCRLYKDRDKCKSTRFFYDPFRFLEEELNSLFAEGGAIRCCSLFLCVTHGGCIKETILMEDPESDFSQTLEIIFEKFGLNKNISRQSILDGLGALLNIYLKKQDGRYSVLHNTLFDFLCYYFGQRYQYLIINYADSEIIRDRTLFRSLQSNPQDFTILIDTKNEKDYIERLIKDMLSGYIDDVLYNHQIRYKDFRYKLLAHLKEYDDDDITVTRVLSEFVLDENERTSQLLPVNFACKYGYRELFEYFLSKTKDVNAYEGNNIPLIIACRKGDKYMTGLLLDKGADVNQTDALGCSPLLWSCVFGNLDIIQMLLNKEADIDNIDVRSKSSPLTWACLGENMHYCKAIEMEEQVSNSDVDEITSFFAKNINKQFLTHEDFINTKITILQKGHEKGCIIESERLVRGTPPGLNVMKKMMKRMNCGEVGVKHDTSIPPKTFYRNFPIIEITNLFLDRGVDIDQSSIGGLTALSIACCVDTHYSQSVSYFLSKGAKVNICDIGGSYPLHVAIMLDNEDLVRSLIGKGAIVNYSGDGKSQIEMAIINQNISIVDSLINAGANLNKCSENETLLHFSLQFKNVELIKSLLKGGILVNCRNSSGYTILMSAVNAGLSEIVEVLIKEGAEVNVYSLNGASPVTIAISKQNIPLVDYLIKAGADIDKHYKVGDTLLHYAIQYNNAELVRTLIKAGISVDCKNNYGKTPLIIAVDRSLADMTAVLIKEGAKVDNYSNSGETPLILSSKKGDFDIFLMILRAKKIFDINETTQSVAHACKNNHEKVVSVLLTKACDINARETKNGNTFLIGVSDIGSKALVSLLIQHGANVNASNHTGATPLIVASMKGHTEIVRLLIAGKADMYKLDENGESALILAGLYNQLEVVKVLIDNRCNIESIEKKKKQTCLSVASCQGFGKIVAYLIDHKAKVNTKSSNGATPLMLAAMKGHLNIVKMLSEHAADVNIQSKKGSTCLSVASSKGFDNIVTYLLDQEAIIDTANSTGDSPLMLASKNGHLSTVKILLENGAKADMKNKEGFSAFDLARKSNHAEIADVLCEFIQSTSE